MKLNLFSISRIALALLICCGMLTNAGAADNIQASGNVLQIALPALALGASLGHRNEVDGSLWDRNGTLQFGESAALTLGVTYALKYSVNEKRPNGGSHSFPSGHTSISFSSAEFLRERYGWKWGMPAYAAASWVAYSRVESRQHRVQDVIAGAGIGILSSRIFTKPFKGLTVQTQAGGGYYGFTLSGKW